MMNSFKTFLREHALSLLAIIALGSSALPKLDAESLSLSLLRAKWVESSFGYPTRETLSVGRLGKPWNAALYGTDLLTDFLLFRVGEVGLLATIFLLLSLSSALLFKTVSRTTHSLGISFLVTLFGTFAIWSGVADLGTSLGVLLFQLEFYFLITGRFFRALGLVTLHPFFDSSYFLAPFLIFTTRALFRVPRFKDTCLLLCFSIALLSHYGVEPRFREDFNSSTIGSFLSLSAVLLAFGDQFRRRCLTLTALSVLLFFVLEELMQLPVLGLTGPVLLTAVLRRKENIFAERIRSGVVALEQRMDRFLSGKNRFGVAWLALAFIFFQGTLLTSRPSNSEALISGAVTDSIVQLKELPLHRYHIGGFLGLRLDAVLPSGAPRNIFDTGPVRLSELDSFLKAKQLFENERAIHLIRSKLVLCQGRDRLCEFLSHSPDWRVESRSILPEQTERQLAHLSSGRQAQYRQKIADFSFTLFSRNN